jgi:hypothetical protein
MVTEGPDGSIKHSRFFVPGHATPIADAVPVKAAAADPFIEELRLARWLSGFSPAGARTIRRAVAIHLSLWVIFAVAVAVASEYLVGLALAAVDLFMQHPQRNFTGLLALAVALVSGRYLCRNPFRRD